MKLALIDWIILVAFLLLSLLIGLYASRTAGRNIKEFFLSNRNMPWWLLGVSMVATTFSCDTPNLVADLVRQRGVYGNWAWWAFLLTGMLTVFIYSRLWRRLEAVTDLEFYEMRYGGKSAAFLRGFRAVYLGFFFNIMVIATVSLALIKISAIMLHWPAGQTLIIISLITLIYSTLGGLKGILLTDFVQFGVAMIGAVAAAIYVVSMPEVGGLTQLMGHPNLEGKLNLLPPLSDTSTLVTLLVLPLAVQWWSVWYPGSEPGGGGYIAQRMLSARDENGALKATLFFNFAHYALRPWPWIIVALASLIVFPDVDDLRKAFPHVDPQFVRDDLAYPAMLSFLPVGLLGLVVASLLAAYMSTVSTQLNWGASYLVNDFYSRFIRPDAGEKELVFASRVATVLLMIFAGLFSLLMSNALQVFQILLQIGAGTGLIFILRWFWWRINAWTEITGMVVSFIVAVYFQIVHQLLGFEPILPELQMLLGVAITTVAWVTVTLMTSPDPAPILRAFYRKVRPGGPGWRKVLMDAADEGDQIEITGRSWSAPTGILCMVLGSVGVYSCLFAIGYWIYGWIGRASMMTGLTILMMYLLHKCWRRMRVIEEGVESA